MSYEGFYSIRFQGAADGGMGMVVLNNGTVTGVDLANVAYDGTAELSAAGNISVKLTLSIPANVALVQGVSQPRPWQMPINVLIPQQSLGNGQPVAVATPAGPVQVVFKKLRDL